VVSLTWIVLSSAVGFGSIAAAIAVPVCRTIRHRQRVDLIKHVVDKKGVTGADAVRALQAVMGVLEQGPPESDAPPQLRGVEALARQARRALPSRQTRQLPASAAPESAADQTAA
jgi:hypothetical protein